MQAWARWSKNPAKTERPTKMETDQYFCEHGLVDFDLDNKHDRKEKRFAVINADDYDQFASWLARSSLMVAAVSDTDPDSLVIVVSRFRYEAGRRISFIFEEELVAGRSHAAAMMDPSPCADCRRARFVPRAL